MSDLYIRVIPTNPEWQPTVEAAAYAVEYVAALFAGPGDHVEAVEPAFYERITLIDGGEYMKDVVCPRCDAAIGLGWFWDLLIGRNGGRTVGEPTTTTWAWQFRAAVPRSRCPNCASRHQSASRGSR